MAFLLKASCGCFKPIKNSPLHYPTPSFTRRFPVVSCGFEIRELFPGQKIYYGRNNLHEIPFPHRLAPNPLINKGDILCVDYFSPAFDECILRFDAPGVGHRHQINTVWNADFQVLKVEALAHFLEYQIVKYDFRIQFDFDTVYYRRHDIQVHYGQIWVKLFRCRHPAPCTLESDALLVYVPGDPHHVTLIFRHYPFPRRAFECDAEEEGMFYIVDY